MLGHGRAQACVAAVPKHHVQGEEQRCGARVVQLVLLLVAYPELECHAALAAVSKQLLCLLLVTLPPAESP